MRIDSNDSDDDDDDEDDIDDDDDNVDDDNDIIRFVGIAYLLLYDSDDIDDGLL